ncbi:MAG TPA: methyltransferase domain-containing protein [Candidatus Limnocylindria bacterium]|nr:methyltransferase domain-containing protein [Candidatus Limnocylindria bacterium]
MATPEQRTWDGFLAWLQDAPARGGVEELLRDYRASLIQRGRSEEDAQQAIGIVMRRLNDPQQQTIGAWALLFDKVFASEQPAFQTERNALLAAVVDRRPPGRALDVCMGEGRNAIFLATRGWRTTGVDVSSEGIARARERAAVARVDVTLVQRPATEFDFGRQAWDLISFLYAPVPITDPGFVARASATLTPGGVVVVESFASDREQARRKPVDIDPRDLRAAFAGFEIERLDDIVDRPDWADAPERMVRMVAVKPAA